MSKNHTVIAFSLKDSTLKKLKGNCPELVSLSTFVDSILEKNLKKGES